MGPPPGYPPPGQAYGPGPAYPPPGPGPYGAPPYPPGPGYGPGYVAGPISKYNFDPVDARTNKWISILAYFGIFFLIPFLCRPQSRFARVHVNNGILLMVANFVVGYPLSLLCFTPLWPVALILLLVAGSFFGILSIVCLVYCLSDNLLPIPFFSKYLEI
jgi:hypothetical protein